MTGFDEMRFDEVLRFLMESRSLRCPDELSRLLKRAGHEVSAESITAFVEGGEWVDGHFPLWVAEALDLSPWEMGILAYAVAYSQVRQSP